MECRLCLCSAPTVSIHDGPHPVAQLISACCQLTVKKNDMLPNMICLSCDNNLKLFSSFRDVCVRSEETLKTRLDIKTEEVLLEDLVWEDGSHNSLIFDESDEWESNTLKRSDHKQNTNSTRHGGETTLCDDRTEMIDDVEIVPEESEVSDKIYSTRSKSELNTLKRSEPKQNTNSTKHGGETNLCDDRTEMIVDVEIVPEESKVSDKIYSTRAKSDHKMNSQNTSKSACKLSEYKMQNIHFEKNQKNGVLLIDGGGFCYLRHSSSKNKEIEYWKCDRKGKCYGRGTTKNNRQEFQPTREHNHFPDKLKLEMRRIRNNMKQMASNSNYVNTTNDILQAALLQSSEVAKARLPTSDHLKRYIQRSRNNSQVLRTNNEIHTPLEFQSTGDTNQI
ncbi:uncharacterized protein LOC143916496 [Arctopsyche grandis]|uniref:uncharacterized protein LOC143916496 n=1 Tax=Arctopsyche grandis TaxID=121162 RepID=UPI00406D74CE